MIDRNMLSHSAAKVASATSAGPPAVSRSIVLFLILTAGLSSIFYTFIIATGHVGGGNGIYELRLMWSPAIAALLTCRLSGLPMPLSGSQASAAFPIRNSSSVLAQVLADERPRLVRFGWLLYSDRQRGHGAQHGLRTRRGNRLARLSRTPIDDAVWIQSRRVAHRRNLDRVAPASRIIC
jgi:hypothetical protein